MEKRKDKIQEGEEARPKRTPLGTRNVLSVKPRPGYKRCWLSDSSGLRTTIADYEAAGYTPVMEETLVGDNGANAGQKVMSVVTRPGGAGVTLYLYEVKEEYYLADQKALEAKLKETEREMRDPKSIQGYGKFDIAENTSQTAPVDY